jgi:integration host factor subunit alpha
MTGKPVTRVDLCEAVYQKVGLSRTESSAFVELVLKEITDCLEKGETVKLSSFGSFMVRKKGQRLGRNSRIDPGRIVNPEKGPSSVSLSDIKKAVRSSYATPTVK